MLKNVKQKTIRPVISSTIVPGTLVYTDEYGIYHRLPESGYGHKTVCHRHGEYARDEDGEDLCEVHVNTWKDFGLCYVLGYGPIVVFLNNCSLTILGFSSSYTT